MDEIIVFLGFTIIYFLLDAYHDSNLQKWRKATTPDEIKHYSANWHGADALIKGIVGGLAVWLIFGITWQAGQYLALFLTIRWIWFDAALNIFNGLPITYVGNTAFLDRVFKMKGTQYVFKFLILSLVIISLFLWK